MASESTSTASPSQAQIDDILANLNSEQFSDWYDERQYRENIENGTPYFNGVGDVSGPERHSPSQLLQCHRKITYRQHNAPAENKDPDGIFWFGTRFEEELVFPFLERTVAGPDTYVRNSEWIDFTIESDIGEIQIKGVTDPLIVDSEAVPILPTEIKTKETIDQVTSPSRHHKAQLHAYLVGLSEKHDIDLTSGVLLYGSRKYLDVKIFQITFDEAFWKDVVLEWANKHTQYRLDDELPPGTPESDWECKFCDFRQRCGQGEFETDGIGSIGLLPLFKDYPRESLIKYLKAHEYAKLTPTLQHRFPKLGREYGSYDWGCPVCGSTVSPSSIEWDGNTSRPPVCRNCSQRGICIELEGPSPEKQAVLMGEQND